MSKAEQKDRILSTSEDPLPILQNSKAEPPIRSRPLSDIYPFHTQADRSEAPYLLSGCGSQVQPVTAGPDENKLNQINSSAWSNPVIGQPEGNPYPTRIMRLFSNSRKGPIPAHSPSTDGPTSSNGSDSGPQSWSGLSGLGVVDSFKKLRSSVLQGIQSRGTISQEGDQIPYSNQEITRDMVTARVGPDATNHLRFAAGQHVSNGAHSGQKLAVMCQCGSDIEDYDDDETDEGDGLSRNTRFSRSIRRAYGAGRISLLDTGNGRVAGRSTNEEVAISPKPGQTSKTNSQTRITNLNTNVKMLNRLSKSAENLHIFKAPFRRKAAAQRPQSSQEEPPRTCPLNEAPSIQRRASASSVDLHGHAGRKLPVKAKGPMLKLVGSMTDVTVRQRQSPSPSPICPSTMSSLSRLHDDYSRRAPCLTASERQRRPSPIRARVLSAGHNPVVHSQPEVGLQQHQVLISPIPAETEQTSASTSAHHQSRSQTTTSDFEKTAEYDSSPLNHKEPMQNQDETEGQLECICRGAEHDRENQELSAETQESESFLQTEDTSPTTSSTPVSPSCLSESPTSSTDASPDSTETSSIKPRRRNGRPRPRPISDYAQLVSRKHSIPEEVAELCSDHRTANAPLHKNCGGDDIYGNGESLESCSVSNGDIQGSKQRPISVIGVVDAFSPDAEEKDGRLPSPLSRPPIPSHQVPPYRAVSARFRPSTLSQSTPIGLDRVGRRKLHRVLSDGMSGCSVTLDDSVSEEEEGSFDELTDGTPYLQLGVELSVLNEWISSGHTVCAEALWDHVTMEEQELAFKAGDVIRVLDASHKDWWWGRGADREAWFPSSFVRVRVNQEDSGAESVESVADPAPRDTHSTQHKEQMRTNVVQEIMNTERIYIKHLKDICEGYIRQCRKHPDMFTELQLKTIFSNIEDIYRFQRQFLKELEKKYNKVQPHLSEIGSCFLLQGEGFSIYSDYCNTHPAASAELQRLMKSGKYKHFFEACRLLQQMIDISIAGFLLTPVQKICKYPLQLGELLKYTPKDHSDYSGVSEAYEAMKNVASLINERKRRLESIDTIAHWQVAILHWEGSNVLERSSDLIHSGELTRVIRQGKLQQRSFFLFDHQLVFCKKDVLRRDLLHYRGRLDMDQTEVLDMPDGRDPDLGLSLRNAMRLRNASTLEFVCVLCCRKADDKQRWLEAFAKERHRVKEDQEMGMEISEEQRKQAIVNARRAKQGKNKTIGYSTSVPPHNTNLHPLHQRHITIPTSVPQQQVFSLAEPPKRKPYHLLYSITRNAFFRK